MRPQNLTREAILQMPAGREMDRMVAEAVMDHFIDPGLPDETAFLCPPEWKEMGAWPSTLGKQPDTPDAYVPHFSTDMSAAWLVVEKLCKMHTQDFVFGYSILGDQWQFSFELKDDGCFFTHAAKGETAPLAICRAALLSMLPE